MSTITVDHSLFPRSSASDALQDKNFPWGKAKREGGESSNFRISPMGSKRLPRGYTGFRYGMEALSSEGGYRCDKRLSKRFSFSA